MQNLFDIVHEDDSLLVVNKPAGLVCHPTKAGILSSLVSRVRLHLGPAGQPQLINRLDRETSGVVLVAKNSISARAWRSLWEQGHITKTYLAIVHGLAPVCGEIDAPLGKDLRSRVAIKDAVRLDGAPARTVFNLERHFSRPEGQFSMLDVQPITGRKHQIRIHLAHIGFPLVGDKLYGADENCYLDFVEGRLSAEQQARLLTPHHCLHARSISARCQAQEVSYSAKPEDWFLRWVGM